MTDDATPAKVRLTDRLGLPLEDALKRAYYYTETGEWRGPEVDEWDRWHAVAKVAAAQVEAIDALAAEREGPNIELAEDVVKALGKAWLLGQTYRQQADSDSWKQNKKADETSDRFSALVEETYKRVLTGV